VARVATITPKEITLRATNTVAFTFHDDFTLFQGARKTYTPLSSFLSESSTCFPSEVKSVPFSERAPKICESSRVESVVAAIKNLYFEKRLGMTKVEDELVFSFEPANGAAIIDVEAAAMVQN